MTAVLGAVEILVLDVDYTLVPDPAGPGVLNAGVLFLKQDKTP